MRYFIRELYYFVIKLIKKIKHKKIKIGFRGKVSPRSVFEGYNKIGDHSFFSGKIGYGSYIGEHSNVCGQIGRYCSIGGHVIVLCSTHPVRDFVSTSPCFYSLEKQNGFTYVNSQRFIEEVKVEGTDHPVVIGNDVYIGYGAILIAPLIIGDGAVIAAGSVVTKNVEPYTIVGGNPAKPIRKRFDDNTIEKLKEICWWTKSSEWLSKNANRFSDVNAFLSMDK